MLYVSDCYLIFMTCVIFVLFSFFISFVIVQFVYYIMWYWALRTTCWYMVIWFYPWSWFTLKLCYFLIDRESGLRFKKAMTIKKLKIETRKMILKSIWFRVSYTVAYTINYHYCDGAKNRNFYFIDWLINILNASRSHSWRWDNNNKYLPNISNEPNCHRDATNCYIDWYMLHESFRLWVRNSISCVHLCIESVINVTWALQIWYTLAKFNYFMHSVPSVMKREKTRKTNRKHFVSSNEFTLFSNKNHFSFSQLRQCSTRFLIPLTKFVCRQFTKDCFDIQCTFLLFFSIYFH